MKDYLSNTGRIWLNMDKPNNLMVMTGLLDFEDTIQFERLCETIEEKLLTVDRFKKRLTSMEPDKTNPVWEIDPYFDIKSHIHRLALPDPHGKQELRDMINYIVSLPLDTSKPLWHLYLIENYETGSAIVARVHPSIFTGLDVMNVLLSLTDELPDGIKAPKSKKINEFHMPFFVKAINATASSQMLIQKTFKTLRNTLSNPLFLLEVASTSIGTIFDSAAELASMLLLPSDCDTILKGTPGVRKQVLWNNPISLMNIKNMARILNVTVNNILISTLTGTLKYYLKKRYSEMDERELRIALPVDLRKQGMDFDCGSFFGLTFLDLPIHMDHPVKRLMEVNHRMERSEKLPDAMESFKTLSVLGMSDDNIARTTSNYFSKKISLVISNIHGPSQPLYFAGKKIRNFVHWLPMPGNVGLGINLVSYNGNLLFGIIYDEKMIKEPETILEGFNLELKSLLDLIDTKQILNECMAANLYRRK